MNVKLNLFALLSVTLGGALTGCSVRSELEPVVLARPAGTQVWKLSEGFAKPECAYYDAATDAIYVSSINGDGTAKDGNGYISKVSTDGNMIEAKWATGLDAPKGLRSHGTTLWAADIDQVVAIDMETGEVKERIALEGAQFLNGLATAADGTVYAADTQGSRIYRVQDGKVSVFAEGAETESPNGLLVDGDRLIVAAWGLEPNEQFVTKVPGRLYSLDRNSGERTNITAEPLGNLDGVELDGKGGYVLTDFAEGQILHVDADGRSTEIKTLTKGSADHAYLPGKGLIVLPHMLDGYVAGYSFVR